VLPISVFVLCVQYMDFYKTAFRTVSAVLPSNSPLPNLRFHVLQSIYGYILILLLKPSVLCEYFKNVKDLITHGAWG